MFIEADQKLMKNVCSSLNIVASDGIDEEKLKHLRSTGHEINTFGIGTHIVTCKKQPALGCVYKLAEFKTIPCIKISDDETKMTLPSLKRFYRLYDTSSSPMVDIAIMESDLLPQENMAYAYFQMNEGEKVYSKHVVTPSRVEPLLNKVWDGTNLSEKEIPSFFESKNLCANRLQMFYNDRRQLDQDDPYYTLGISEKLYELVQSLKDERNFSKKRGLSAI